MLTVTCKDVLYLDVLFKLYKNNLISYENMLRVIMKKKLYILPYSGKIYSACHGIVKSNLLYNQCLNPVVKNNYCVKCYKQSVINASDLPKFGNIKNRDCVKYKPVGNHRYNLPLANVVDLNNDNVKKILKLYEEIFEVKIPEHEYILRKITRGRPKLENKKPRIKSTRKRGRPKKVKIKTQKSLEKTILDNMGVNVEKQTVYVRKVFIENVGLVNRCDQNYIWSDDGECVAWWDSYR